jgi:hypothetical protein
MNNPETQATRYRTKINKTSKVTKKKHNTESEKYEQRGRQQILGRTEVLANAKQVLFLTKNC